MRHVALLLAFLFTTLVSTTVLADSQTGNIIEYHLNSAVAGRNVCVRTNPAASTTWICVWQDHLTQETGDLLREAYLFGKTCTFEWATTDANGFALLEWVSCF